MGATTFEAHIVTDEPLAVAFNATVEEAAYIHGHGGYTGTIAEKSSVVEFHLPEGVTPDDALQALSDSYDVWTNGAMIPAKSPEWAGRCGPHHWETVRRAYNDKWGPAVAIKTTNGWLFCGWASE